MRIALAFGGCLLSLLGLAQWDVPVPIVLEGAQPEDRQVLGLADPVAPSAAMSVDATRDQVVSFATVTGSTVLTGTLSPAPSGYAPGMLVTIVPTAANAQNAMLDLNGLGAQGIVKQGGLPLDSADLIVGSPARLIHDGVQFRLISSTYLPCPQGFRIGGREFCIEDSVSGDTTFFVAYRTCRDRGARLCTVSEWSSTCRSVPGFIGTVLNYEWVDSAANDANDAKTIGRGPDDAGNTVIGCEYGNSMLPSSTHRFRCCTHR